MNDLQRILDMAVRMNAHDSRKARDIFGGRLRELGEFGDHPHTDMLRWLAEECSVCPTCNERHLQDEPMTADEYRAATDDEARDIFGEAEREGVTDLEQVRSMAVRYHEWAERDELYRQATVHGLRQADLHDTAPRMRVADAIREHREGLELQAGLEEAVRRTRADLEANPDIEVV